MYCRQLHLPEHWPAVDRGMRDSIHERLLYDKETQSVRHYAAIKSKEDWNENEFALNLKDITYTVEEYIGRWWQGACFRKKRSKRVLDNVTTQFRSGEITAILGSSGKTFQFSFH